MEELLIITKSSEWQKLVRRLGVRQFQEFINSAIRERTLILMAKPVSLREEKEWSKSAGREIGAGKLIKIILAVDGKLAGVCDVQKGRHKQGHNATFGLMVVKKHRGKGYGEMLLRKGIEVARKRFRPHKMWIEHIGGNEPARKLYEKAGFREVARLKEYVNHFGSWRDRIIMEYKPGGRR
ncbi:MAG: GNAT family protein [Candidatus Micrarchaeota archaeon]